jgi:hypothetical protein
MPTGKAGMDRAVCAVLCEAWRTGFTTKSDFGRENADYVAIASCMGWITTRIFPPDVWGSTWNITSKGLLALESIYGVNTEEDPEEEEAYLR